MYVKIRLAVHPADNIRFYGIRIDPYFILPRAVISLKNAVKKLTEKIELLAIVFFMRIARNQINTSLKSDFETKLVIVML